MPGFLSIRRRTLTAALVVTAALAVAGCGSGGTEVGATGSTARAIEGSAGTNPASGAPLGNAQNATSTSTAPGANATTSPPATAAPTSAVRTTLRDPLKPLDVPDTSECAPGPGALPDGLYFGFIGAALDNTFEFDLACWFSGAPATQAAAQDGQESPPPNDYYIRNTNKTERTVAVASSDVPVAWLSNPGSPTTTEITYNQWLSYQGAGPAYQPPIWITIRNGAVIDIVEQYLP
jgi:hypothetical protein